MRMSGLTEVRMPQPSLSPREHVGRSSGGREAAPSGQGFVLTAWKGRGVGSGSFSALCQLEGRLNPSLETAFIVFRCSASLLH